MSDTSITRKYVAGSKDVVPFHQMYGLLIYSFLIRHSFG